MKTIKPSSRLSLAALLLASLTVSSLWSAQVMASEVRGVKAAVVGARSDASAEGFINELSEEITDEITEEFSDDMLDFILSSDAEILQAIEHRPLLDLLDNGAAPGAGHPLPNVNSGGAVGIGDKTGVTAGGAKQAKAADRRYE